MAQIDRRSLVTSLSAMSISEGIGRAQSPPTRSKQDGALKQSVCKWCYRNLTVEELAQIAAQVGITSVELVPPEHWPTLKRYGLSCAMASHGDALRNPQIRAGLNRKENHDAWEYYFRTFIEAASETGVPNVICFSGWREGMSDDEGIENCAIGLERVMSLAERKRVTICMELLNSKFEGKRGEYMCDHTKWGVKLAKRVGSSRFKLLYDIFHMQVMEGDIIRTLTENWDYIGHIHTAGNPGRHEIDETQELNYGAIAKFLAQKNYSGFIAHEFLPTQSPAASLAQAYRICHV